MMTALILLATAMQFNADDGDDEYKWVKQGKLGNQVKRVTLSPGKGCSKENYMDALTTLYVAQHAADKKYGENGIYDHTEKWYKWYTSAMKVCGWIMADLDFSKVTTHEDGFTMDEAVIDMMEDLLTPSKDDVDGNVKTEKAVLAGLKSLSKDGKISIFNEMESHNQNGHWQVGQVFQNRFGVADISLGCLRFHVNKSAGQFLWWKTKVVDMSLFKASQRMVLNPTKWKAMKPDIISWMNNGKEKKKEENDILGIGGDDDDAETMSFSESTTTTGRLAVSEEGLKMFCELVDKEMGL